MTHFTRTIKFHRGVNFFPLARWIMVYGIPPTVWIQLLRWSFFTRLLQLTSCHRFPKWMHVVPLPNDKITSVILPISFDQSWLPIFGTLFFKDRSIYYPSSITDRIRTVLIAQLKENKFTSNKQKLLCRHLWECCLHLCLNQKLCCCLFLFLFLHFRLKS